MATVVPINPDRHEALQWLRTQLRWETTLQELRDPSSPEPRRSDVETAA